VGDSAAMVMHGHATTIPADIAMLAPHVAAVKRGAPDKFIIADMPFLAHRKGLCETVCAAEALFKAGGQAVKIEGAAGNCEAIHHLVESGIPVMGHLGLTPQSIHLLGGYKVQAQNEPAAGLLLEHAQMLQEAGCFALVLECVPAHVAERVTESLAIPTIGIGAGPHTTGQVLVLQDLLGMSPEFKPKFVRTYLPGFDLFKDALARFDTEVKNGQFPSEQESYQ
jgi:3-methyl-2-oxobutanoate hydroxymethyltransferase